MLLTMAIILAFCSAFIEFKILKSVPFLGKLNRKSMFFGLVLSFAISAGLGGLFGAAGVCVMLAGVLSTAMTEPVHAFRRKLASKNADVQAKVALAKRHAKATVDTYKPVAKVAGGTIALAAAPLWLPVMIHQNGVKGSLAIGKKFLAKAKANRGR